MLIDDTFRVYTDDDILKQWLSWEMNWLYARKLIDRLGGAESMGSGVMDMHLSVWMFWYTMYRFMCPAIYKTKKGVTRAQRA